MLKLSDHMTIVSIGTIFNYLKILVAERHAILLVYPSFFIDFSLIHKEPINIHSTKIADYLSDYMVIEHCHSNHLTPIIAH